MAVSTLYNQLTITTNNQVKKLQFLLSRPFNKITNLVAYKLNEISTNVSNLVCNLLMPLHWIFVVVFDCSILSAVWAMTATIIVIPLIPIWVPVLIVRILEKTVYKLLYGATVFNWEDVMWLDELPKNKSIINCILLLRKSIKIEELQKITFTRMVDAKNENGERIHTRITRYIYSGFVNEYWIEEKKFDIRQHVYEWSDNIYESIEDLQKEMSIIATSSVNDNTRISPWELLLLHYYEDDVTKSALIFRSHNSLADGATFVHLLLNQISDVKSKQVIPYRQLSENDTLTSVKSLAYVPLLSAIQLMLPTPSHDLHCALVSEKKSVAWSDPIDLFLVKSIKEKLGVSINDILVGCFATNIHRFFKAHDKTIPCEIMTSFSVNANSLTDVKTNKFAVISIPIPTASGDVLHNILNINRQMSDIKSFYVPNSYRTGYSIYNYCLPRSFNKRIRDVIAKKSSMVMTNVPGPENPVKIGGRAVEMVCFWPPQRDSIGMASSIFSYAGNVMIGLSCDKALNINPYDLLQGVPGVISDLVKQLGIVEEKKDYEWLLTH